MSVVRVLYLGRLQDIAGRSQSEFASSSGDLDWPDLLAVLETHVNPAIAEAARDPRNKLALNGQLQADREGLVFRHGDEVALLPPVSGG
ncbi:MAG: MoaD/ThiS family protein [Erythrobacter sp.]|jgi:molybdopterin synthase sulfur carrier subunit